MRRLALVAAAALVSLAAAAPAGATWSIVAVDPRDGAVGGAVASCVDPTGLIGADGVLQILALVPGVGAGVTQADVNLAATDRIRDGLEAGSSAAGIVEGLTGGFDPAAAVRQHAVVRLDTPGAPAAFTGAQTQEWAGHRTGDGVSVQGNILVSEAVVTEALASFRALKGKPLAHRLAQTLLAGSRAGGDARCPGQTALFAHLAVAARDGKLHVRTVEVAPGEDRNPVELLAAGEPASEENGGGVPWWAVGAVAIGTAAGAAALVVVLAVLRSRRR